MMINKTCFACFASVAGVALFGNPCFAAVGAGGGSSTPSSGENAKIGDYVELRVDSPIFNSLDDKDPKNPYCAPSGSIFEISNIQTSSGTPTFSVDFPKNVYFMLHRRPGVGSQRGGADNCAGKDVAHTVKQGTMYTVTDTKLNSYTSYRLGWTWGALLIPYKFEFKDRTFKGQPSTVGYVGYEGWIPGLSYATVVAIGPGIATSSTTTTAQSSSGSMQTSTSNSTNVTYTVAVGGIFTFGAVSSTQLKAGIMFGKDYQGSGSGFQYENRTWMALSVGAAFN